MAGDMTCPFEGLNANVLPKTVATLSREQFLYSLARTPSPARFQRPHFNRQAIPDFNPNISPVRERVLQSEQFPYSLSRTPNSTQFQQSRFNPQVYRGQNDPFQTDGVEGSATPYLHDATNSHDATSAYGLNTEGPNSEPPGKNPVTQIDRNLSEANKRQNLSPNGPVTNFQRLAPGAESRSTLPAAQIPTPSSEKSKLEASAKTTVRVAASEKSSIAPSSPTFLTSAASVELGEYDTSINLCDESGYDSNESSVEESVSLYTDSNIHLSNSGESGHATAPSTGVSCLETNARTQGSPPSQQDEFSIIDESFGAADEDQILPGPSKKNPKRGTRSGSKILAQDATLQTTQENLVDKTAPGEIYRTFGQLQLTEEKAVQKSNSESVNSSSDDDNSITETQVIVPETPLVSIRKKRFPESSPQKPRKKSKKTYPNTKMMSSKIHFKDLALISAASVPPNCPKPIPTRLNFCDGFVGEESQPIGCTKAASRPRRLPRPGVLRRSKGYTCQLPLVQSRTFGDDSSLQEGRRNPSTAIFCQSHETDRLIDVGDVRIISNEHHTPTNEVSNSGDIADYEPSIVEDVDMAPVASPRPEESELDNDDICSTKAGSPQLDISPVASAFKRRVTFNEDVEVIRQQLAMVSAPLLNPSTISDDESNCDSSCDSMDEDDEDMQSEGSDNHASENSIEAGSSADEHSIEPFSPRCNGRFLNTTLPSTPIRRFAATEAGEAEAQDDEMILDDTASMISERYQVSDAVHLWEKNYDDERVNLSPNCPWAPRRAALARSSIEVSGDMCISIFQTTKEENRPQYETQPKPNGLDLNTALHSYAS
ncbi:hypothetical protein V493_08480 [Pseudogymnoascus sp. VKM F-4281 (FW-2241)]|nr:hypothetical protein V493_08480 [Pseudogymnoascus sp. VKM F-4281 (FW-2241)]